MLKKLSSKNLRGSDNPPKTRGAPSVSGASDGPESGPSYRHREGQGMFYVLWFVASIIVGVAAENRGRFGFGWLLLACFISPVLALVLLLVIPNRAIPKDQIGRVPCPACRELVLPGALKCRFCGADIPQSAMPSTAYSTNNDLAEGLKALASERPILAVVGVTLIAVIFSYLIKAAVR